MGTKQFCAGVDIGGTKISSALFTRDGAIAGRARIPIDEKGGDHAAIQIAEIVGRLKDLSSKGGGQLLSIALSVPGVVYPRTGLVWAPNIPGLRRDVRLRHRHGRAGRGPSQPVRQDRVRQGGGGLNGGTNALTTSTSRRSAGRP
jgi:predicted NBD/HSP70 family sugar kinase